MSDSGRPRTEPRDTVEINVRLAKDDDRAQIDDVLTLACEDLRRVYRSRPDHEAVPHGEPAEECVRIVATVEGKVVGTVRYQYVDGRLHLTALGVHPAFRRVGVARGLIEFLDGSAWYEGADRLSLHTVKETGNVAIFEKLGFQVVREVDDNTIESDQFDRLTDVFMERPVVRPVHSEPAPQKLSDEQKEELRESVIEGCREMADVMLEMEREWHSASDEVWRKYPDG